MEFQDRLLTCSDCRTEFIFTAGEQLFFFDKQFKNDPKRCKLCKAKRSGAARTATVAAGTGAPLTALPLSRTETRTDCSACGIETTVPFRPTQGRPVLCRSCYQMKRVPSAVAAVVAMDSVGSEIDRQMAKQVAAATAALQAIGTQPASQTMDMIERTPSDLLGEALPHGELTAARLDS